MNNKQKQKTRVTARMSILSAIGAQKLRSYYSLILQGLNAVPNFYVLVCTTGRLSGLNGSVA